MVKVKVAKPKWHPTERNFQVLAARIATGSRKNAAAALGLSLPTVEKHLDRMRIGTPAVDDAQLGLLWHDQILPYLDLYE